MKKYLRPGLFLFLLISLALLAGCGSKEAAAPPQAEKPKELKKITLGQSVESLANAPIYVAKAMGYFKEEGIDLELTTLGAGPAFQTVMTGQVPFVETSSDFIISAINAKADEAISVANNVSRMTMDLVVRNEKVKKLGLSRNMPLIDRYKALKGMTIGYSFAGAATEVYTRYYMRKAGLDPDKDATLIAIGGAGAQLAALSTGQIDAFQWTAPTTVEAVVKGLGEIIISSPQGDVPEFLNLPYDIISVNKDYAKKNPETVKSMVKAIGRGANLINDDPEKAREVLSKWDYFKNLDPKIFNMSFDQLRGAYPRNAAFNAEGMKNVSKIMVETGKVDKEFDATEGVWWTNQYQPK